MDSTTHTRGSITGRAPAPLAPRAHHHAGPLKLGQVTVLCLCRAPAGLLSTYYNSRAGTGRTTLPTQARKASAQQAHSSTRAGRATGSQGSVSVHFLPRKHLNPALPSPPPVFQQETECHFSNPGSSWGHCLNSIFSASHFLRTAKAGYEGSPRVSRSWPAQPRHLAP